MMQPEEVWQEMARAVRLGDQAEAEALMDQMARDHGSETYREAIDRGPGAGRPSAAARRAAGAGSADAGEGGVIQDYATGFAMATWADGVMASRPPDFIIGGSANPYMLRWHIVPRNEQQNVYLHHVLRDDDDRALHDHPWDNVSMLLAGRYREITPEGDYIREAGSIVTRKATALHRLALIEGAPAISLFFTGPKVRDWGFACPQGWVHWRDFTGGAQGELIGRGCGEMDMPQNAILGQAS